MNLAEVMCWASATLNALRKCVTSLCRWQLPVVCLLVASFSFSVANALEVRPELLMMNATMNDSTLLEISVEAPSAELVGMDIRAIGISIQRQVATPTSSRRIFLVAPDTSVPGRVNASIEIVNGYGIVLHSIPLTGEVKPCIQVTPNRLFLGSLKFGSASQKMVQQRFRLRADRDWKITSIDVSDIPNAQYEITESDTGTKELCLMFSEDAFKKGQPFGAFINRFIHLRTNVPAQPEINLIVTAMLSKNGTKRDFNTFVFKGKQRWQGPWMTPNVAAAIVGPVCILLLGYGAWLSRTILARRLLVARCATALFYGCALACGFALAATYSRGGWTAFGTGLAAMLLLMRKCRRSIAVAIGVFLLAIAALPAGTQRVASAGEVIRDGSVRNRLLVWRGALEMIADNPLFGVGAGRFGEAFDRIYQEPWHKAYYTIALNDYLTFAAERGLPFILAIVGGMAACAALTAALIRVHDDHWMVPPLCAMVTLCTSALFSSIEFVREVRVLALLLGVTIAGYCFAKIFWQTSCPRVNRRRLLGQSALAATVVVCLIASVVVCAEYTRIVYYHARWEFSGMKLPIPALEYRPAHSPLQGTVLYLPEVGQPSTSAGRQVLRPLAEHGWRAICAPLPCYDQEASVFVRDLIDHLEEGPLVVLAEKSRTRAALGAIYLAARRVSPGLVCINPVATSPLPECDKSQEYQALSRSIRVVDSEVWVTFKRDCRLEAANISKTLRSAVVDTTPEHLTLTPPSK